MAKIPNLEAFPLAHGTVKEVTLLLRERGEDVTYHQIAKRIERKSHVDTLKLAVKVSKRLMKKRETEQAEIQQLIQKSHKGGAK